MTYTQLKNPNLGVVGYPDLCLSYVENVFGTPHLYPTAWSGWNSCTYKHTDQPPTTASVPIWFSWTGTVGGVRENYGHVAVWNQGKVYTNPLQGSGHVVFNSINDLVLHYGVTYVGWSEDLATQRIVQESTPRPITTAPAAPHTITLPASNPTWRVYKVAGPYTVGHEVAKLAPAKFGGLTYTIQKVLAPYVYEIKTQNFGLVAIYGGPGTGAIIK